jgi:hypothetical protein
LIVDLLTRAHHAAVWALQRVGTLSGGLAPGQETVVIFNVTARDLSIVDFGGVGDRVLAPGEYTLSWEVGSADAEVVSAPLTIRGAKEVVVEPFPNPADVI